VSRRFDGSTGAVRACPGCAGRVPLSEKTAGVMLVLPPPTPPYPSRTEQDMAAFQCSKCKRIKEFKETHDEAYKLAGRPCTVCWVGEWVVYDGPMAKAVLDREDAEVADLVRRCTVLDEQIQATMRTKEMRRREYESSGAPDRARVFENTIALCNDTIVSFEREIRELDRKIREYGVRSAVRRDADVAFNAANAVQAKSTKNKLYIGSRQFVSQFASGAQKKRRILDVPNWSWGLNLSWVEGGITARARFKLKLDERNPYSTIPPGVLQKLRQSPGMQAETFLELCRTEGPGSLLWYDADGENRPTWTALEIASLLRAGYRFGFLTRASNPREEKIVLDPPA